MKTTYFDYAATTPVDPRVLEAMLPFFTERYGNANSLYATGRDAFRAVEAAREQVAALIGAERPDEVIFTSGGTESDNAALVGILSRLAPDGGGQEFKKRSGTQNTPGAAGFAKALEIMVADQDAEIVRLSGLRDRIIDGVLSTLENTQATTLVEPRLPHIASLLINGVEGEAMLLQLDNLGIEVSTGSACSSGSLEPSHVLLSIGCPPEIAHGSLRISLGRFTTDADIDRFLEVFPPIVERLRAMSPVYERMFGSK